VRIGEDYALCAVDDGTALLCKVRFEVPEKERMK
jgi:hypothetical protein